MSKPPRPYVPLDLCFFDDPKVLDLPDRTALFFLHLLATAKRLHTDGEIQEKQVASSRFARPKALLKELITAGLLQENGGKFVINSWRKWNASPAYFEFLKDRSSYATHSQHHTDGKALPGCLYCPGGAKKGQGPPIWKGDGDDGPANSTANSTAVSMRLQVAEEDHDHDHHKKLKHPFKDVEDMTSKRASDNQDGRLRSYVDGAPDRDPDDYPEEKPGYDDQLW